jgi:hypothetical protein
MGIRLSTGFQADVPEAVHAPDYPQKFEWRLRTGAAGDAWHITRKLPFNQDYDVMNIARRRSEFSWQS